MEFIDYETVAFAQEIISRYDIDASHGMAHAIAVAELCYRIVQDLHYDELPMKTIVVAGFVHDLVDDKYVDERAAIDLIKHLFTMEYPMQTVDYIMQIITHISFSKRVKREKEGKKMIDMAECGYPELQLATEIVCDADMLDAYDINRCVIFSAHICKLPINDPRNMVRAKGVMRERILLYKDRYFNTSIGKLLCAPLHDKLKKLLDS